ncbi:DUF771 domain-containing protein [Staphylococcus xylosus]|uniref:DUF771 domain-containing protein n=1 Tax=Staphylococcus xylosus TaxID=1288 RepID=UPI001642E3F7|nr:DUF771 domain-containing protein [Staphylococcus xylosus]MEB8060602.1 DUF771 domain-containing protein [Staphylococcus xylosus]
MTQLTVTIPEQYVVITKDEHNQLIMNQQKAVWTMDDLKENLKIKSDEVIKDRLLDRPKFKRKLVELDIVHEPNRDFNQWRFNGPKMYQFIQENWKEIFRRR